MSRNRLTAFTTNGPRAATRLWKGEDGLIFAYVALALPLVAGMVGLGVDIGHAFFQQRRMQVVADNAAAAARFALNNSSTSIAVTEGKSIAGYHGFTSGVQINCALAGCDGPIQSPSSRAADAGAVEAIVTRSHNAWLGNLFGKSSYVISARSLVTPGPTGDVCILALGTGTPSPTTKCTSGTAFSVNGASDFGSDNCGVAVNSGDANAAADFNGSSATASGTLSVCGGVSANKNLVFEQAYSSKTNKTVADPFKSTTYPWLTGLSANNVLALGGTTRSPVTVSSYTIATYKLNTNTIKNASKNSGKPDFSGNLTNPGTYAYNDMSSGSVALANSSSSFQLGGDMTGGTISNVASSNVPAATTEISAVKGSASVTTTGSLVITSVSGGSVKTSYTSLNSDITGTYGAVIDTVSGGTIGGAVGVAYSNGVYSIRRMIGGTLDGASGGTFYIGDLSGGTLQNGIFYVYNLSGSPTTSNATLVLIGSANFSGGEQPSFSAPTGTPTSSSPNLGIAITSPNNDSTGTRSTKFSMSGTSNIKTIAGAMYFPVDTSTVGLQGVSSTCSVIIASVINLGGNVSLSRNNCALQIAGAVPGYPRFVY